MDSLPDADSLSLPDADSLSLPDADPLSLPDADPLLLPDADSLSLPEIEPLNPGMAATVVRGARVGGGRGPGRCDDGGGAGRMRVPQAPCGLRCRHDTSLPGTRAA